MAHQSQLQKMKGELQQAVAMIQNIPSMFDFRAVRQDIAIGQAQIKGLCARCEALEKANTEATKRAEEAEAAMEKANTQFQELVGLVQDMYNVLEAK